uniref:Uncharacterized protein n=1 Tax=Arion vulgaris TaxID=1028688 RepID=A0A0B6ZKP6_9EUPU
MKNPTRNINAILATKSFGELLYRSSDGIESINIGTMRTVRLPTRSEINPIRVPPTIPATS